jgi:hypothetical protein
MLLLCSDRLRRSPGTTARDRANQASLHRCRDLHTLRSDCLRVHVCQIVEEWVPDKVQLATPNERYVNSPPGPAGEGVPAGAWFSRTRVLALAAGRIPACR